MSIFSSLFGDANSKMIDRFREVVEGVNSFESDFEKLSLEELKEKTNKFRERLSSGESLDDILPEAFAAVREASRRTLKQRHYDVQLMGGIALHNGTIAEMKTGEGKTLVATLPAYLNALEGKGVHIITVNDYLARRDTAWMGQVFYALGVSAACLNHEASYIYDPSHSEKSKSLNIQEESFRVVHEFLRPVSRSEAYSADITYGTNNEFGFDYLRDNMEYRVEDVAQSRGHEFAIVDEIDSILIDEARTPLIISAPDEDSGKLYQTFARVVPNLKETEDYTIDEKLKAVSITEHGIEKIEKLLNIDNIYEEGGTRYVHHLQQALRGQVLFHRDKEYVVKDGEVIIVDEFTGRLMPGRRWSEGLHQAVEAKEGVMVQKESRTLATITFQNYFRLYKKLSGMTGTAQTSAEEFHKVYKLDVVSIPTNKPAIRVDLADRVYMTEKGKFDSVIREVKERNSIGQPVLIGTVSIQKNELLSSLLSRAGIKHNVLNAKNHEREAEFIAQAGSFGAVTVATNMAGRGVDIILGGNPPSADVAEKVRSSGGLFVIGTERHDARRIDDQLRGRSGRQGDPGGSQFFVSAEDELIRIFGGDKLKSLMSRFGVKEDEHIENRFVSKSIEQAQNKIEGHNFDTRKYVLEYDDVMNKHRTAMYELRNEVLRSESMRDKILEYLFFELDSIVDAHVSENSIDVDEAGLKDHVKALIPIDDVPTEKEELKNRAEEAYKAREMEIGEQAMRNLERMLLMRVIDELWVDHLDEMEHLRDSVRLRAYGQRDPLIEYKIEGQKLFTRLQSSIGSQISNLIFKIGNVQQRKVANVREGRQSLEINQSDQSSSVQNSMQNESMRQQPVVAGPKIGRNDPCPCGSGKKYKKCGLINAPEHKK